MFEYEMETTGAGDNKQNRNEIKISVKGLCVGMYVTRVERPWIETTFPPNGFRINSQIQIDSIKRNYRTVFVDTLKGVTPDSHYWILDKNKLILASLNKPPIFNKKKSNEYTKLKKNSYEITSHLETELKTARETTLQIARSAQRMLSNLQAGKPLDIEKVKVDVTAIVDSVIRNPAALSLLSQLKNTDNYSYSHALATCVWCAQFGRHLGLAKEDLYSLALGGILLDIGKMKLPTGLLNKQSGFTREDLRLIRTHVNHSVSCAAESGNVPQNVLSMIATHHERANGSGYPKGLKNHQIPIFGRIAGIVDSYDAMTSIRSFNPSAMTPHDAVNELYHSSGDLFQANLVEQFIKTVGAYPTGSLVEFATGQVGVVTAVHDLRRLYPTVMLLLDSNKQPLDEFVTIDLSAGEGDGLRVAHGLPHGAHGIKMDALIL